MNIVTVLDVNFEYGGTVNTIFPVILSDNNNMILIDCGYQNFLPLIEECARKKEIELNKLTKIIITHHDYDHMGSLADFKRKYPNIEVLSSYIESRYISGEEKSLRLKQAEFIYDTIPEEDKEEARNFQHMLESIENVKVDTVLKDKEKLEWCGGMEIIETPGHMPGHISIYLKESKTLIAGDALVIEDNKLVIANPQYTLDMEKARNSIIKLLNYDIEKIICYHGGIYRKNIRESLMKI
ncbi:MBL fold metallo-hydrolase [Clostridium sp. DSM 100503]|uniref:MBL fold metallo-hydrolase n=1 Tax=Clostridium sp. DSM 100503 TaxID=2963282 RepID=UPI00214A115A|nr:MBL fold metallo-hydrolase [Clostridium sp. DSM 100503]MCR1951145.1 MBL fold metallo-hydrolase [Clostridium sp. DSM 100503]